MTTYELISLEVKNIAQHYGQSPHVSKSVRAFAAAILLRKGVFATVTQTAVLFDLPRVMVDDALIVLEAECSDLVAQVRDGNMTLSGAAKMVKDQVRLVRAFAKASPVGRAAFGCAVGADALFDSSVVPALEVVE
jgi:hypothetical protein